MNTLDSIIKDVIDMLAEALSVDKSIINNNFTSSDHQNWDSLANMTLSVMLYERYSISITPDSLYTIDSVDKLSQFISNSLSNNVEEKTKNSSINSSNITQSTINDNTLVFDMDLLPLSSLENATKSLIKFKINNEIENEKLNINIASTFTTRAIESPIKLWLKGLNKSANIIFSDYNQIETELISKNSNFHSLKSINIILIRPEDLISRLDPSGKDRSKSILNAIDEYLKLTKNSLIVSNMPPITSSFYSENINTSYDLSLFWNNELKNKSTLEIFDFSIIITNIGSHNAHSTELEITSRSPYSQEVYQQLGINIVRLIRKLNTPSKKVIVLDADNTLWDGVIGEDGIDNIKIGNDHPGRSFRLFQEQIMSFKDKGILLALASKNEEKDVIDVLNNHPGMLIKNNDFSSKRINWLPKSENIRSIAKELNIGLDSVVFLDDSAIECLEVKTNTPEVTVIKMPENRLKYGFILSKLWIFDSHKTSHEDKLRHGFIVKNKEREKLHEKSANLNEYLESLNIIVEVKPIDDKTLPRISQLSQKTNQFNTSLNRRSIQDLHELDKTYAIFSIDVADKFGDYGLVGACILKIDPNYFIIDSLFISCRALGRQVEHAFMYGISKLAIEYGARTIKILYTAGPRNQQIKDFLLTLSKPISDNEFEIDTKKSISLPNHINWQGIMKK